MFNVNRLTDVQLQAVIDRVVVQHNTVQHDLWMIEQVVGVEEVGVACWKRAQHQDARLSKRREALAESWIARENRKIDELLATLERRC